MDKITQNQRGLELVNSRSSGYKTSFKNIPLFAMYYLTKSNDVMESSFWVIPKLTFAILCKSIHGIINYFSYICAFEPGKCGKEGEKITKTWISWQQKELFTLNKNYFS